MNFLTSIQCIFEENSASSAGGIFELVGPNYLSSENNAYLRNSASTGSVLSAESVFINIKISDDRFWNNGASTGTIYAGELGNVHISNTEFLNNTSEGPSIYITKSVKSFICLSCVFSHNMAEVDGVLSISFAEQVVLNSLEVLNNNVTIGSMIMIKKSINTTVLSSFFQDNLCSLFPCAMSVQKSNNVKIKNFLLTSYMSVKNMISELKGKQGALDIDATSIALENLQFNRVNSYVTCLYHNLSISSKSAS